MTASFIPQPYPLYAVTLQRADEPLRFELTDPEEPVRLVLGWVTDDSGATLPALAGGAPIGTAWDGPVFYEETRERADQVAKRIDKADRASVRDAKITALFNRVDAYLDRANGAVERKLPR